MSDDFNQWRDDHELIHYEKEQQDRAGGSSGKRLLMWVLVFVIVLPIAISSCADLFGSQKL